mmetsp:Transcript_3582/g.5270  ORF Transcript_3582/g.5270 Transcript_3582/m.5270 type:complete len:208 (+) Transcript_3582:841-1464(+)
MTNPLNICGDSAGSSGHDSGSSALSVIFLVTLLLVIFGLFTLFMVGAVGFFKAGALKDVDLDCGIGVARLFPLNWLGDAATGLESTDDDDNFNGETVCLKLIERSESGLNSSVGVFDTFFIFVGRLSSNSVLIFALLLRLLGLSKDGFNRIFSITTGWFSSISFCNISTNSAFLLFFTYFIDASSNIDLISYTVKFLAFIVLIFFLL